MTATEGAYPAFADARGTLVPIDLAGAPIDVRRVFVVAAPPAGGVRRGDHRLHCREVIVLVSGSATVETSAEAEGLVERRELKQPGDYVVVGPEGWLRYSLHDARSVVLVLADAPYVPEDER